MFKDPKFAKQSQRDFGNYFSGKLIKQKQQELDRTDKLTEIFAGTRCYVNGFSSGEFSAHLINKLISSHGGRFDYVLRTSTTHWVCESIPDGKVNKELTTKRRKLLYFVTPNWVVDSVDANKRLPERNYIIKQFSPQAKSQFFNKRNVGDVSIKKILFRERGSKPEAETGSNEVSDRTACSCVTFRIENFIVTATGKDVDPDMPLIILDESRVVVYSDVEPVYRGMTQSEMVLALGESSSNIRTVNEEKLEHLAEKFCTTCRDALKNSSAQVSLISRDTVMIAFHAVAFLDVSKLVTRALRDAIPGAKLHIETIDESPWLGLTWQQRKTIHKKAKTTKSSPKRLVTHLSKNLAAYTLEGALMGQRNTLHYTGPPFNTQRPIGATTPIAVGNNRFSCSRNFGCNFRNEEALRDAVERTMSQGKIPVLLMYLKTCAFSFRTSFEIAIWTEHKRIRCKG